MLGLGRFAGVAAAENGVHRLVAAESVPGAGLRVGPLGVVAVPGRAAVVGVGGFLGHRGAGDGVLLGDAGDQVLVEPVVHRVRRGRAGQVPVDGHAGHRVAVLGGRHAVVDPRALRGGVVHQDLAAGLGGDLLDARALEGRLSRDQAVDPVVEFTGGEGHGGELGLGLPVGAGVLDGGQPQRGLGAVTGVGEGVVQGPGVDRAVAGPDQHLGGDPGQALGGEEGRPGIGAAGRAQLVQRDVRPVGGVRGGALGGVAGDRSRREAALGRGEGHLGGGLERAVGGGLLGQALAVGDFLHLAAADVRGERAAAAVLAGAAAVVVALGDVGVADQVLVGVHHVVEVPAPPHGAPGTLAGPGVVAGVSAVGRVDRLGPGRVRRRVGAVAAGEVVLAEPVLGAVGDGDLPVLAVVEAVGSSGQQLDLCAVVPLQVPHARGVVPDEGTRVPGQREGGVLAAPAEIAGAGDAVLRTRLVGPFDEAGLVGPAVTDPGRLRVDPGGLPVHGRRVVGQGHGRRRAGDARGNLDGVGVGEVAYVRTRTPGRRRRQGGRRERAGGARGAGGQGQNRRCGRSGRGLTARDGLACRR